MTIFVGVVAVLLIFAAVWASGLFNRAGQADAAATLRELLLQKAQGKIGEDEFNSRQAALHELLLQTPEQPAVDRKALYRAAPLAVAGLALLIYALTGMGTRDSARLPGGPSLVPAGLGDKAAPMGAAPGGEAPKGGDLNSLVKGLAEKMERDPNNADGWQLLARTYVELRQHAEADKAFAHVATLTTLDAQSYADWADAHVMANDRKWDDKGRDLIKRALKADGKNSKALSLAGSEAFDRQQYKAAIDFWKRQKAVEAPDSMAAKLADSNIEEATALMSGKKPAAEAKPQAAAVPAAGIAGTISIDAKLKGKFAATDTVFLVVKAADGSNPPLAAKKLQVSELPYSFQLSDADAMMPSRTLSAFPEMLVSARVSKSGAPTPQAGDVMSNVAKAKLGDTAIKLEFPAGK